MLVPYTRPRGAVHDLLYINTLGCNPCKLICISERTLYLLQNFATADVAFTSRYAVELLVDGYIPLDVDHPLYSAYLDAVNGVQLEVLDVSCDIESGLVDIGDGLRAIADAMGRVGAGGGCGAQLPNPAAGCIANLPNDVILGPPDMDQGDPGVGPPPDGFATWEEYFLYKCQAALFIWNLERAHMVALRNFEGMALIADIVVPIIAGLSGVLPAAMTPAGFVALVTAIVAIGIVAGASWFYLQDMIDWWDEHKEEIICALYTSGTSVEAVSALAGFLEDSIQAIVSWGALAPLAGKISGLLSGGFAQLAGNGIVEPLFKAIAAVQSVGEIECAPCKYEEGFAYVAKGSKGGSMAIGYCFRLMGGQQSDMEGRPDGMVATFRYNDEDIACGAFDNKFRVMADFGSEISGSRQFYIRARKTAGVMFAWYPFVLWTNDPELWDQAYTTGNFTGWSQAQGATYDWLDIGSDLDWRLVHEMSSFQPPESARYWAFECVVPAKGQGWSDGATWECDSIRVDVS